MKGYICNLCKETHAELVELSICDKCLKKTPVFNPNIVIFIIILSLISLGYLIGKV